MSSTTLHVSFVAPRNRCQASVHHDPRHWKAPDLFDPDRWLTGAEHGPCPHAYVPFGWAPKTCIGAGLGTTQLMLLCHLFLTRYRVEVEDPESVRMMLVRRR